MAISAIQDTFTRSILFVQFLLPCVLTILMLKEIKQENLQLIEAKYCIFVRFEKCCDIKSPEAVKSVTMIVRVNDS